MSQLLVEEVAEAPAQNVASAVVTPRRRRSKFWRIVGWTFVVLVGYVGFEGLMILATNGSKSSGKADAAIVLGASAWNGNPSKVLAARVDHAVDLYKSGRVSKLVFTGGSNLGDVSTEADAARNYAVRRGVPASATLVERKSHTTYENLLNAARLVEPMGVHHVFLVSDGLHLRRSVVMAGDLGLQAEASPTPYTRFKSTGIKTRFAAHELGELLKYRLASPFLPKP